MFNRPPAIPPFAFSAGDKNRTVRYMTQRDWLAGMAMSGILANPNVKESPAYSVVDEAYLYADKMMAAGGHHD